MSLFYSDIDATQILKVAFQNAKVKLDAQVLQKDQAFQAGILHGLREATAAILMERAWIATQKPVKFIGADDSGVTELLEK